jgi:hypothetical protein
VPEVGFEPQAPSMISLQVVSIDVERQAIKPDRSTPLVGPAELLAPKGARNAFGPAPKVKASSPAPRVKASSPARPVAKGLVRSDAS